MTAKTSANDFLLSIQIPWYQATNRHVVGSDADQPNRQSAGACGRTGTRKRRRVFGGYGSITGLIVRLVATRRGLCVWYLFGDRAECKHLPVVSVKGTVVGNSEQRLSVRVDADDYGNYAAMAVSLSWLIPFKKHNPSSLSLNFLFI